MLKHAIGPLLSTEKSPVQEAFATRLLVNVPISILMGICTAKVFLHGLKLLCSAQLAM
jgi:hypothetical protein